MGIANINADRNSAKRNRRPMNFELVSELFPFASEGRLHARTLMGPDPCGSANSLSAERLFISMISGYYDKAQRDRMARHRKSRCSVDSSQKTRPNGEFIGFAIDIETA